MPTKLDAFGMVFVDALAAGTPVIATTQYAVPEIITDGQDGLLIKYKGLLDKVVFPSRTQTQEIDSKAGYEAELSNDIYKILKKIASGKMGPLSGNSTKKFKGNGILSIEKRNKQLKKIYEEAII
jgi:glycosyltransferase involved in cell wall biosynthesis